MRFPFSTQALDGVGVKAGAVLCSCDELTVGVTTMIGKYLLWSSKADGHLW